MVRILMQLGMAGQRYDGLGMASGRVPYVLEYDSVSVHVFI